MTLPVLTVQTVTMPTAKQRLIEVRLGYPLAQFVAERPDLSWRQLAKSLGERTGETVSHELLRQWIKREQAA